MTFQELKTADLVIRPFGPGDAKTVYRLSQEPSLGEWIPDQVYRDEAEAAAILERLISHYRHPHDPREAPLVLAVVLARTNDLIGHVGLSPLRGEVEIGYAISEAHCGRGYATQAVSAMSRWAISNLPLEGIVAVVASENAGSSRVLEKSGYELEGEFELEYLGKMRRCRRYSFGRE